MVRQPPSSSTAPADPTWPYGPLPARLVEVGPTWECPSGDCVCHPTSGEHQHGKHTIFFHDDRTGVGFLARIDQTDLAPFDKPPRPGEVKSVPSDNTQVRLDALDRIADALKGTPIRRLLLHTCNAGRAPDFVQFIANRLRIPVMAQTDFIWFRPDASFYDQDKEPKLPRDEEFWPIHRVGEVKFPSETPPPRFGPPKP